MSIKLDDEQCAIVGKIIDELYNRTIDEEILWEHSQMFNYTYENEKMRVFICSGALFIDFDDDSSFSTIDTEINTELKQKISNLTQTVNKKHWAIYNSTKDIETELKTNNFLKKAIDFCSEWVKW